MQPQSLTPRSLLALNWLSASERDRLKVKKKPRSQGNKKRTRQQTDDDFDDEHEAEKEEMDKGCVKSHTSKSLGIELAGRFGRGSVEGQKELEGERRSEQGKNQTQYDMYDAHEKERMRMILSCHKRR